MRRRQRLLIAMVAGVWAAGLAGCINQPVAPVSPSFEVLRLLREEQVPSVAMGTFVPAQGVSAQAITIRGSRLHAPAGSNFAEFLGTVFETDLAAAGKLDADSAIKLSGVLTASGAGENISAGKARLGVDITLAKGGVAVFAKQYSVESAWDSDFIGAIAVPDAFHQYNALYAALARKVMTDREFVMAVKNAGSGLE